MATGSCWLCVIVILQPAVHIVYVPPTHVDDRLCGPSSLLLTSSEWTVTTPSKCLVEARKEVDIYKTDQSGAPDNSGALRYWPTSQWKEYSNRLLESRRR